MERCVDAKHESQRNIVYVCSPTGKQTILLKEARLSVSLCVIPTALAQFLTFKGGVKIESKHVQKHVG